MAAPSATGYLKLDINGFQEAIHSAKRLLGTLAGAFAAFKTAEFFKNGIESAIDFGHEIHQASMRMGQMDPGNLLIAQKVLERMGLGADEARSQLEQMVESGKPLASMFKSAEDYGKAIAAAKGDYGSQASVLSKSAKEFNAVFYTIKSIGEKVKTLFLAATSGFLKPMKSLLDSLNKLDLAPQAEEFGKKIGGTLTEIIGAFKDGKLWDYTKLNLTLAFLTAGKALSDVFSKSVEILKKGLDAVFSADWFKMIYNRFAGFFAGVGAIIAGLAGADNTEREYRQAAMGYYEEETKAEKSVKQREQEKAEGKDFFSQFSFDLDKNLRIVRNQLASMTDPWKKEGEKPMDLGPPEGMRSSLGAASGPWSVIADDLARIGGGGNYITSSLSPEAKEAMKANQQLKVIGDQLIESNKTLTEIKNAPPAKGGKLLMKK